MEDAARRSRPAAVTVASRAVSVDGLQVERGAYLGLVDGDPVAGGTSFDTVAASVVDRLLAEPRDVLTLITGEDEPELGPLLARSPSGTRTSSSRCTRAASRTIRS